MKKQDYDDRDVFLQDRDNRYEAEQNLDFIVSIAIAAGAVLFTIAMIVVALVK